MPDDPNPTQKSIYPGNIYQTCGVKNKTTTKRPILTLCDTFITIAINHYL